MDLNPLYESHIGRVAVAFELTAPNLDPDEVSKAIDIKPDNSARQGDERRNQAGDLLEPHQEGWWKLSSKGKIESKDINEHFKYLLDFLLPHKKKVLEFAQNGETYFDVHWESSYLYAGTGPIIERECISGIAELNAEIGFDIYQIENKEKEV